MQMFLHDKGELNNAESACEDETSVIHLLENQQAQNHKLIFYAVKEVTFVSMFVHSYKQHVYMFAVCSMEETYMPD